MSLKTYAYHSVIGGLGQPAPLHSRTAVNTQILKDTSSLVLWAKFQTQRYKLSEVSLYGRVKQLVYFSA